MAFRDVLVVLDTYPEPTPVSAMDDSIALAAAMGARVSALACATKFAGTGSLLADQILDLSTIIAEEAGKSLSNAEALLVAFREAAEKSGVFQECVLERFANANVSDLVVEHARHRDLTIVPIPRDGDVSPMSRDFMIGCEEKIVFGSGRPSILLPFRSDSHRKIALETIVVAWDFSRSSSRALADAMPVLEIAKTVFVVTVIDAKAVGSKSSVAALAANMAHHGVNAIVDQVDGEGREIADVLQSYVASRNGDLLVMGAYGHSPLREAVFGGVTKRMLQDAPIPIFLSH